jgi:hypothetical protein
MVNTTIHKIITFLSKDIIIFLIISLLNFSFINYDWEKDIKSRDKVHKNISTIFNSSTYTINNISDNFYTISESERIIGYLIVKSEFSKNKKFDYFIIYNNSAEILKVEILNYRESHGFEICNKRWLKQFIGNNSDSEFEFNSKVDAISGATISVNSLKTSIFKQTQTLKRIINE